MGKVVGYEGGVLQQPTGSSAYSKLDFYAKGNLVGICVDDAAANSEVAVHATGVHYVPTSPANLTVALGDALYCADNAGTVNKTAASRKFCGVAIRAKAAGDATVPLLLSSVIKP